eukprot:3293351-Ditylum_brightwellii.AAC.1
MLHCHQGAAALAKAPPAVPGAAASDSVVAPRRSATGDLQDGVPAPCPPPCSWILSCWQTEVCSVAEPPGLS